MEYKIKSKLIDGEEKFGIINDKLEVVLPFKYSNIEEKTFEREIKSVFESGKKTKKYYILSDFNNKKGIFLNGGLSLIEPMYDYIDYIPLFDNGYWSKFIVGQQIEDKMEYGILERQGPHNSYEMVYPFGKADEIKVEDDKVMLYKNKGNRVLIGVFNDSKLGTFDPKYTQLDLGIIKPKIEYITYGKIRKQKEVKGILVKNIKSDDSKLLWKELVPCEYSNFSIDTSENLIKLSQVKNRKELKGLMGFSICEKICTPEFTIPCQYDDISLLYDASISYENYKLKFFLVEKNGKSGLLKVRYSHVRTLSDNTYVRNLLGNTYSITSYNYNPPASVEILLECKYDNISCIPTKDYPSFIFTSADKKGLLIDGYYDKDKKSLHTNCEYKSIISSDDYGKKFVITDFNDKKSIFVSYEIENKVYEFKHTSFEYDSIQRKDNLPGILQCSKKIDETQYYDIYDNSLNLIVASADSVNFGDSMCKAFTNIDKNITRITFADKNGNILLDEQGENIKVSYSKELDCFFILRNNIIQVKKPQNQGTDKTEVDIQGDYTIFDFTDDSFIRFKKATDNSKMGVYKLDRDSWTGRNNITILLKDEYEHIDIVGNGTRSIVSKIIDDDVTKIKYGVMENNMGNECIPIEYGPITFDGENFIAINRENDEIKQTKFDSDGFYLSSKILGSQVQKKELKLN